MIYKMTASEILKKYYSGQIKLSCIILAPEDNLQGANLRGVTFFKPDLEGANLQKANLEGANFEGANLQKANLQGANLQKAIFQEEANLQRANLIEANLQRANLQGANFEGANLQKANLEGANLIEANLQKANLEGANLIEANLQKANLIGVDLQGAILQEEAKLQRPNLREANLQGAILKWANLKWAILKGANLQGANLQGANLIGADLIGASLQSANLKKANLIRADLQGAKLQSANLIGANLEGADLQGAILKGASLQSANLKKANLVKANLKGANFKCANFDEKTKFPSGFDPLERGMLKIQPSQPHSSKAKNLSKTHNNQSSVVTSNNELPEIPLSNFKTLEDFQENLQTEVKEPVSETNDQTVSQAFDLNKQEFLETEMAQIDAQIDNLSSTIIDEELNQEIIQNTPIDNQSEASQNFTDPESIHTQISAEQSVSSLSQSTIEQENREPIHQQETQSDSEEGRELNEEEKQQETEEFYTTKSEQEERKKITVSILPRPRQLKFRQALLNAYNSRCAITGYDAELALEAAHIIPYSEEENNHPSNGLLLRADIHKLFDENLIAIDPETMTIHLDPSLRETCYKELHGKELRQPKDPADLPKLEALKRRYQQCKWMQR